MKVEINVGMLGIICYSIYVPDVHSCCGCKLLRVQAWMSRSPLAISAAGGSLTALLWDYVWHQWTPETYRPVLNSAVCDCPLSLSRLPGFLNLDLPSFVWGILVGLALGPLIEVIFLLRQLWVAAIRRQFASTRAGPLFRVL